MRVRPVRQLRASATRQRGSPPRVVVFYFMFFRCTYVEGLRNLTVRSFVSKPSSSQVLIGLTDLPLITASSFPIHIVLEAITAKHTHLERRARDQVLLVKS